MFCFCSILLLWLECEISSTGSYVGAFGPQLGMLVWKVEATLGGGTSLELEEVGHWAFTALPYFLFVLYCSTMYNVVQCNQLP